MTHYEIEFRYSSSPQYRAVIELLQTIPGATTDGSGHHAIHRVVVPDRPDPRLRDLMFFISSWRSTRILVDGVVAPAGAPGRMRRLTACTATHDANTFPGQYCWGEPFSYQRVPCRLFEEALPWMFSPPAEQVDWLPVVSMITTDRFLPLCPWFSESDVLAEFERAAQRAKWRASADPIEQLFGATGLSLDWRPWWM